MPDTALTREAAGYAAAIILVAAAFVPTAAASPGEYGTFVEADDEDALATLQDHSALSTGGGAGGLGTIKCVNSDSDGTSCDVDPDDPVYIDMDDDGTRDAGDIRLTQGKSGSDTVGSAGDRVQAGDDDCCSTSYDTFGSTPTIFFVDDEPSPTDGERQTGEDVYIDASGDTSSSTTIDTGDIGLAGSNGGDRIESGDSLIGDTIKAVAGSPNIHVWDADGDGSYGSGDSVYFDMDNSGHVTPGDIAVYQGDASSGSNFGDVVDPDSSEVAAELHAFSSQPAFLYDDSDPDDDQYTSGESLWLDTNGDGSLEVGDVWLIASSGASGSEGDQLDGNDDEIENTPGTIETLAADRLKFRDVNNDGSFGQEDSLYVDTDNDGEVDAGDVRLNDANSLSFGDISSSDDDVGLSLSTGVSTNDFNFQENSHADGTGTYNATLDSSNDADRVYFDTDDNQFISPGDIEISSNAGSTGDVVTDSDSNIDFPCESANAFNWSNAVLYGWDQDGNGNLNIDEGVYLSRTDDSTISTLDIRLATPNSDLTAGEQVRSGDMDQTSNNIIDETSIGTWRYFDEDGDNRFDTEDSLFIDVDDSGTISVGDVRVIDSDGGDKGEKVTSSDDDLSRSISTLPNTNYCAADASGDGSYSLDDYLYLDTRETSASAPTVGDVRISGSGGTSTVGSSGGSSGGGGGGGGGTSETAPSININSPSAGTIAEPGSSVTISGTADGGSDSISSVTVTANGQSLSVSGASSWSTTWTTPSTTDDYQITATVQDNEGDTASDSLTLTVGQDSDGDGVADHNDNCPDTANADQADEDGDGTGDLCEDADGDGIIDQNDNCPDVQNPLQADLDDDGTGDECDDDVDGDGVPNAQDDAPRDPEIQSDQDLDGVNDDADNCPSIGNPDQADIDGDGTGDKCDDDIDGDGLPNAQERELGTDRTKADTDDDGHEDGEDNCPTVANPDQEDADEDGIGDACDDDSDVADGGTDDTPAPGLIATLLAVTLAIVVRRRT